MTKIHGDVANFLNRNVILPIARRKWNITEKDGDATVQKKFNIKLKSILYFLIGLVIFIAILVPVCILAIRASENNPQNWLPVFSASKSKLGIYSTAAVSSDTAPCAPIGRRILEKNGSAVDAAIAMLVCMGAVNPQSSGLGGGFHMIVYKKNTNKAYFFDARERAPLAASENMFNGNSSLAQTGPLSIAVPGELAGYDEVYRQFGYLPWADLIQPTIELCKEGIPVSKHLAKVLKQYEKEITQNENWKAFINTKTGEVYQEGDKFLRTDLAATLEIVARDGKDALYNITNSLAKSFLKDLNAMGSIITQEDMEGYSVSKQTPLRMQLRDNLTLYTSLPPGSGVLLGMMMNILEGYNMTKQIVKSKTETVLALHRMIETFKYTYARRMELEDNATTMPNFVNSLTSKEYAAKVRSILDDERTFDDPEHYGLKNSTFESDHGTASMSVVAQNGDAVAATSTVNIYFGSREMSTSTGIFLNDEMDDFSLPNLNSYFGVPPSVFNRIRPGKRPASSMCPTIIVDSYGNAKLAISGNGGTKITTNVLQVTLRNLWLLEDAKHSIDGFRIHHQLLPNYVECEEGFSQEVFKGLEKKGHELRKLSKMSGIVTAVARTSDGKLQANSDFRKGGEVDGF